MKPKDLKVNYKWEDRRPFINDGILYVPDYYVGHENFEMPLFSEYFGNENSVQLEFCSGNGDWIIEKAISNPSQNWIGVEKQFKRVRKIWSKRSNNNIKNLLIVCGDARDFVRYYLKDETVSKAYVNFPDPWPKDKHAKHRLLVEPFIKQVSKVLVGDGTFTCVTDDKPYVDRIIQSTLKTDSFRPIHPDPYYLSDLENYGYSYFQSLWKSLSRTIYFLEFQNIS